MLVCKPCNYHIKESAGRGSTIQYCPKGHELERSAELPYPTIMRARKTVRFFGILIDSFIIFIVGGVIMIITLPIPIFSQELAAIIIFSFWLLRDINGRSPGKAAMGVEVVSSSGTPSTSMQRIMRNVTFGVSILPLFIPLLGYLDFPLQGLMFVVECMFVLIAGDRIGDKLAGTIVVQQGSVPLRKRHLID